MEVLAKSLSSIPRTLSICKLCCAPSSSTIPTTRIILRRDSVGMLSNTLAQVHGYSTTSLPTNDKELQPTTTTNTSRTTNKFTPVQGCSTCSQQVAHASTTHSNCTLNTSLQPHSAPSTPATTAPTPAPPRINRRTELDFEELRALQVAGAISLIDVRHPAEIENSGEIPGAINIPLCKVKVALQLSEEEWAQEFCMEKPCKLDRNLVFYARGPNASSAAVEIAHRLGFKKSRHYIGGWEEYCRITGQPIKKLQDDSYGSNGNFFQDRFDQYFL